MAKFAKDVVKPKVHAMDEAEKLDPVVLQGLFEQGVIPNIEPCVERCLSKHCMG